MKGTIGSQSIDKNVCQLGAILKKGTKTYTSSNPKKFYSESAMIEFESYLIYLIEKTKYNNK